MISYHPVFSWYGPLVLLVAIVAVFVLWPRGKTNQEHDDAREDDSHWFTATTSGDGRVALLRKVIVDAFLQRFPWCGMYEEELQQAISMLHHSVKMCCLYQEPLTVVISSQENKRAAMKWGEILVMNLYPPPSEKSKDGEYSEIEESGAFDRSKSHRFSVAYASPVIRYAQKGMSFQAVLLVPDTELDDMQDDTPVLLLADVSGSAGCQQE